MAREAMGSDPGGHRAEFVALVRRSRELARETRVATRDTDGAGAWEEVRE
jgi:hypothetical protein